MYKAYRKEPDAESSERPALTKGLEFDLAQHVVLGAGFPILPPGATVNPLEVDRGQNAKRDSLRGRD